ncbi:MAG TPA: hypothetical protein VHJ39_16970 [Solirubrobacteraceae bacterium]|nr:hypothetical protein [Solirubrobacteraceae bacterium]
MSASGSRAGPEARHRQEQCPTAARAWKIPRRLGRILPEVDIEGEGLAKA